MPTDVDELVLRVVAALEDAGVRLDRPLTEADVARIEKRYGFGFAPDHRALLRTALPVGDRWLNWRHATGENIRQRLTLPLEGMIGPVRDGSFWPASWGPRPAGTAAAEQAARAHLARAPVLVPLYSHHYLPAAPTPAGRPVFCVDGPRVVRQGHDLLDYVEHEFRPGKRDSGGRAAHPVQPVPFWSDLIAGDARP